MSNHKTKTALLVGASLLTAVFGMTGCSDADVASSNLSKAADALHEKGLFAVLGPDGEPVTIGSTGWSARAEFLRQQRANWTKATEKGFRLVKLQILETISPTR